MSISVGSVSVDIVPDTTKFRRDLDAKLKDLSVDVRAELRDKEFKAQLAEATRDKTVNVRVDDKGSIKKMQGRTHALVTTLALLAPAAAPLTAVAVGGAVALTGLGAAGFLAFKGISAEMKAGTALGKTYTTQITALKGVLVTLEKTAAKGVLDGVVGATTELTRRMPFLNQEIGFLSQSLGSDLRPLTAGLLGLFQDLSPITHTLADGIHSLALDFEGWANGPGGRAFAAYLAQVLPQVGAALGALTMAGAHLVQALLPLGGPVLGAIKGISDAISAIPVRVIQDLFVAFAAYKTITLTTTAVEGLSRALVKLGIIEKGLAVSGAAGGGRGGIVGAAGGLLGRIGIGGAISGTAGVIAGGVGVGVLAAQLIDEHQSGVNAAGAKQIAAGGPAALAAAKARLAALQAQQRQLGQSLAAQAQHGGIDRSSAMSQAQNQGDLSGTTGNLADQIKLAQDAMDKAAAANKALGLTADGTRDAITGETTATAALIAANDKLVTAAQGVEGATIGVAQASHDANAALKTNGKTLDLSTQKGRDNRTALLNLATAIHTKVDADAAAGKSQKVVNADLADGREQLIKMAEKFGLGDAAAKRYADRLLGIPKKISTAVNINTAAAMAKVAALKSGLSAIQFYANQKDSGATPPAKPGKGGAGPSNPPAHKIVKARGGLLTGPGTGTSDSIPLMGSSGEFMIRAAAVQAVGVPFLNKLNATGAVAGGQSAPQVVQNIMTQPGMNNQAVGDVVASRLSVALTR